MLGVIFRQCIRRIRRPCDGPSAASVNVFPRCVSVSVILMSQFRIASLRGRGRTDRSRLPRKLDPVQFINRELSLSDFNGGYLSCVMDPRYRLLERLRFLRIVSSNLDEFFEP